MDESPTGTPRLVRVESENFKGLGKFSMGFASRLTVLIGPNGVGKSSVLQQIEAMGRVPWDERRSLSDSFAEAFTSSGLRGDPLKGLRIVLHGSDSRRLAVEISRFDARNRPDDYSCDFNGPTGSRRFASRDHNFRDESFFAQAELQWFRAKLLRLELGGLQKDSVAPTSTPELDSSGYGLPSVLAWLATTQRRSLDQLEQAVRGIVPEFDRVSVRPVTVATGATDLVPGQPLTVAGQSLSVAFRRHETLIDVPARHVSEGTLLILAVLAAAYSSSKPKILLVEDIERGLHPSAQQAFVRALRDVLNVEPDLQIVATTHSPYVLDYFNENEVIVLRRSGDRVLARRFSEHPKWERARLAMGVGEFWTAVGEDWIFRGDESLGEH